MADPGVRTRPGWWVTAGAGVLGLAVGASCMVIALGWGDSTAESLVLSPPPSAAPLAQFSDVEVPAATSVSVEIPDELLGRVKLTDELSNMVGGTFASHVSDAVYPTWPAVSFFVPVLGGDYERENENGLGAIKIIWMPDPTGKAPITALTEEQMRSAREWAFNGLLMTSYDEASSNGSTWTCSLGPSPLPSTPEAAMLDGSPDTSASLCSWVLPGTGALLVYDYDVKTMADAMRNTAIIVNAVLTGSPDATPSP